MKHLIREAFWYSVASGLAMAVDVGLLLLLVELMGWHYLTAATASFIAGTIVIYIMSITAIFKHRRIHDRRLEFGIFALIGGLGVMVNLVVLRISVEALGLHYLAGKFLSVGFTFTLNFGLRRTFLFRSNAHMKADSLLTGGSSE